MGVVVKTAAIINKVLPMMIINTYADAFFQAVLDALLFKQS